jgi:REP element-mobilizing transposase RayT
MGRGPADVVGMTDSPRALPLAHLITFHSYGTWLPGDPRGAVRRGDQRGDPYSSPNEALASRAFALLKGGPVVFGREERVVVLAAIVEVCRWRAWRLHAAHVRGNHAHVVVGAAAPPAKITGDVKAWSTRHLVKAAHRPQGARVWARGFGTRHLWQATAVEGACSYVLHEQGAIVAGTVWPAP